MEKKVGVLGSGMVGQVLANGFLKHGYPVMVGTGNPEKLSGWKASTGGKGSVGTFEEAAKFGEIVVVAVKGTTAEDLVKRMAPHLAGKTVIDATNPIADLPPENGVLKFFTNLDGSLMERSQKGAPSAHFVKAFNSVGSAFMVNPHFNGTQPTMFICGNNGNAKKEVTQILNQFGWEVTDMGGVESARAIEPLCILWCIPGLLRNEWSHGAFKLLKK